MCLDDGAYRGGRLRECAEARSLSTPFDDVCLVDLIVLVVRQLGIEDLYP